MHGPDYRKKRNQASIEETSMPMRFFALFDRGGTYKYWMACL